MDTVQMLNLILIVILVLILVLGFIAGILIFKMRKKKEPQNDNIQVQTQGQAQAKTNLITRDGKLINSIYKFMEFDEVLDNMIVRKGRKQYVMVIECKGINYDLLSEEEKNAVESGFIEFLNTLRFSIQLYVQTRKLNFEDLINNYHSKIHDIDNQIARLNTQIENARRNGNKDLVTKLEFEKNRRQNILEYGESITDYTERLSESKNILQQKTYIIISYYTAEFGDTSNYSNDEIDDIAFSELYTRAQTLIRALASAEVTGKVLNSEELMELLYVAYNREQSEIFTLRNALNSEYDKLYSTARDVMEEKKNRINRQIEADAAKLASKSIIDADKEEMQKRRKEEQIRQKALEMVEEYKDDMSKPLFEAVKQKVQNANVEEEIKDKPKRRVIRKNV